MDPVDFAQALAARLSGILGEGLLGVYLHGSAALGGWNVERSDVDVLAVSKRKLTLSEKGLVAGTLTAPDCSVPGAGLEFSLMTEASLKDLSPRPQFELHVATGASAKVVDGAGHSGDPDLVMHYVVCRERGVALYGPPPAAVFPKVPRQELLETLLHELAWGLEHAPARYAVLNACRAWAYAEDSGLVSKVQGAEWALAKAIDRDLVRQALASQAGGPEFPTDERVADLVRQARAALEQAIISAGER